VVSRESVSFDVTLFIPYFYTARVFTDFLFKQHWNTKLVVVMPDY